MSAARHARMMLADDRALEEEAERVNPVNPKKVLGAPKGYLGLVKGSGATPSMGLSQFRGGAEYSSSSESESDEELVGSGHIVGAGTKKGQMRKTARKAYKGSSEAHEMGKHLSQHLHGLHGAGFWSDFKDGFMSVINPIASVAKAALPLLGPEGAAASGVLGAVGLGKKKRGGAKTGAYEGKGTGGMVRRMPEDTSGVGYEALESTGSGKADGRKARAEVVKKVMRDRGVSMIEASKIVKSEGLY